MQRHSGAILTEVLLDHRMVKKGTQAGTNHFERDNEFEFFDKSVLASSNNRSLGLDNHHDSSLCPFISIRLCVPKYRQNFQFLGMGIRRTESRTDLFSRYFVTFFTDLTGCTTLLNLGKLTCNLSLGNCAATTKVWMLRASTAAGYG